MARSCRRNRQKMWFSIPNGTEKVYETDNDGNIVYLHYESSDGEIVYYLDEDGNKIPNEVGEVASFSTPTFFYGQVSSQLENAIMRAWGSDNSNNYAVLTLAKRVKDAEGNYISFPNGTQIWRCKDIPSGQPDYIVSGVMTEELGEDSYYLTKFNGDNK